MDTPLFETENPPEQFEDFHFMVRGWTPPDSELKFKRFLRERHRSLRGRVHILPDSDLAFIRLENESGTALSKQEIEILCLSMIDPSNRRFIDKLTTRSLIGIYPINNDTRACWSSAVFGMALENGPRFLDGIEVKQIDHIPNWTIILAFAMMTGINLAGYQLVASTQLKDIRIRSKRNISEKIATLFGSAGVASGASFLEKLADKGKDAPDLLELDVDLDDVLDELKNGVLGRVNELRHNRGEVALVDLCNQALSTCNSVILLAAKDMLSNKDLLDAYTGARKMETASIEVTNNIVAAAALTNTAAACQVVSAPFSSSAAWSFLASGGVWPTMVQVTNPVGLAVGAVGLAMLAVSAFKRSAREQKILYHQSVTILISQACNIVNEASLVLACICHLQSHRTDNGDSYLKKAADEEFLKGWNRFVKRDRDALSLRQQRTQSRQEPHAATKEPTQRSGWSKAQKQVYRYLKEVTREKESELRTSMERLRRTGTLDPAMSDESSVEGYDSDFAND